MEDRTITRPPTAPRLRAATLGVILVGLACPVNAHPHVFVDGGIDFVFAEDGGLTALELTWLYDEFETLYMVSQHGLSLNAQGDLNEEERRQLVNHLSAFPEDFDGSAHLSLNDAPVELKWPRDVDARLLDGRLELTFTRDLATPLHLDGQEMEVGFYEATYFFAFKVTNAPKLIGSAETCAAEVIPFSPDPNDASLFAQLAALSREETPANENVGANFADRIAVRCD